MGQTEDRSGRCVVKLPTRLALSLRAVQPGSHAARIGIASADPTLEIIDAAAWTLTAQAQQSQRVRRIGVLNSFAANDPESRARLAFAQGLHKLGWADGRNVRIDVRSSGGDADSARTRNDAGRDRSGGHQGRGLSLGALAESSRPRKSLTRGHSKISPIRPSI